MVRGGGSRLVAVLLIITATVAGCARPVRTASANPDFSGLVSVDGQQLYLECHGTGSPTVVLQSGLLSAGDHWQVTSVEPTAVMPGIATSARVCTYDRPGTFRHLDDTGSEPITPLAGRSGPAQPRTGAEVVAELHTLLQTAQVPSPFVLVGHSLGGLFNLQFARTFPDEIAGLVMVDSTPPALRDLYSAAEWKSLLQDPVSEPDERLTGYVSETYDLDRTLAELKATSPLPRKPALILVRAAPGSAGGTPEEADYRIWRRAQDKLAVELGGARVVEVLGSSHDIHEDSPSAVVDAVREVSDAAR